MPGLSAIGLVQPVANLSSELNQMFMGQILGSGTVGGLATGILGQTQLYVPPGQDWRAQQIIAHAVSAATQLAAANAMYNGTQSRLNLYPQLGTAIGGSVDIKDAMDANSRLVHESMIAQGHLNQLLTLQMAQNAQTQIFQAQEEQAWRCSADQFAADTAAAAQNAAAGNVTLINASSGGTACASAAAAVHSQPTLQGGASTWRRIPSWACPPCAQQGDEGPTVMRHLEREHLPSSLSLR